MVLKSKFEGTEGGGFNSGYVRKECFYGTFSLNVVFIRKSKKET